MTVLGKISGILEHTSTSPKEYVHIEQSSSQDHDLAVESGEQMTAAIAEQSQEEILDDVISGEWLIDIGNKNEQIIREAENTEDNANNEGTSNIGLQIGRPYALAELPIDMQAQILNDASLNLPCGEVVKVVIRDIVDGTYNYEYEYQVSTADNVEEESEDEDYKLSLTDRLSLLFTKNNISSFIYDLSYYAGDVSLIFFILFMLSRTFTVPFLGDISAWGAVISMFLYIAGREVADKLNHRGYGIAGWALIALSLVLFCVGIYGLSIQDMEWITAGMFGLFLAQFLPSIFEVLGLWRGRRYPSAPTEQTSREKAYDGGPSYNILGEILGIPQPQEPPVIEMERDNGLDDDWNEYLHRHGITMFDLNEHSVDEDIADGDSLDDQTDKMDSPNAGKDESRS